MKNVELEKVPLNVASAFINLFNHHDQWRTEDSFLLTDLVSIYQGLFDQYNTVFHKLYDLPAADECIVIKGSSKTNRYYHLFNDESHAYSIVIPINQNLISVHLEKESSWSDTQINENDIFLFDAKACMHAFLTHSSSREDSYIMIFRKTI